LPLGSFAFSSGLESYLAHSRGQPSQLAPSAAFASDFLPLSVSSYASTTLPFLLAAHRDPSPDHLVYLDDALDAAIVCTVGRRASIAQGRALLSIWERSLAATLPAGSHAADALTSFSVLLKSASSSTASSQAAPPPISAHLPPLFGAVASILGLSLSQTAYVFMLSHVKALISAAVRAGLFGPYHAQKLLAGLEVQSLISAALERHWDTPVELAGQSVPVMDLWIGRHEALYSRIFNS
jgi:urease accessory protein